MGHQKSLSLNRTAHKGTVISLRLRLAYEEQRIGRHRERERERAAAATRSRSATGEREEPLAADAMTRRSLSVCLLAPLHTARSRLQQQQHNAALSLPHHHTRAGRERAREPRTRTAYDTCPKEKWVGKGAKVRSGKRFCKARVSCAPEAAIDRFSASFCGSVLRNHLEIYVRSQGRTCRQAGGTAAANG